MIKPPIQSMNRELSNFFAWPVQLSENIMLSCTLRDLFNRYSDAAHPTTCPWWAYRPSGILRYRKRSTMRRLKWGDEELKAARGDFAPNPSTKVHFLCWTRLGIHVPHRIVWLSQLVWLADKPSICPEDMQEADPTNGPPCLVERLHKGGISHLGCSEEVIVSIPSSSPSHS